MSYTRRGSIVLARLLVLLGTVTGAASAQVSESLRQAVAASGGRVIITLRTSGEAALRAPGSDLVTMAEANVIATRLRAQSGTRVRGQALKVAMLFGNVQPQALEQLVADPSVAMVEPDVLMDFADTRESPRLDGRSLGAILTERLEDTVPWGISRVNAPAAWAAGVTGSGVKVGIIDSGIDIDHPDLQVSGGYDFTTGSGSASAYDDNIGSCNGHGTHVAGTVAARQNGSQVVGVAPGAQLYALKVFEIIDGSCRAWSSNQIAAINWAVSNGLKVVSISIGSSTFSTGYQNAINTATNAGVNVVAAAGNNGATTISYPAAYTNAIAVGSLNGSNAQSSFSNSGSQLWVAAPGEGIESTMPGGGLGGKSGTSMATPHVSGLVALYLSANPNASPSQVRNWLRDGATDVGTAGFDNGTGYGLAQASGFGGGATPPPVPLAMTVSPTSRSATAQAGSTAPADSASITLSGDNSGSTAWTATKRKSWATLTTASGTGSGRVRWSRSTSGLAAGTYVDTITVAASGVSSRTVIDTLIVTPAPVPLAMSVSPTSRSATAQAGSAAPSDSATVTLSGDNSGSTAWTATKRKSWTTLTTASGTGSGRVRWSRSTSGLAAGTYVDTITVAATGVSSRTVIDTLIVTSAPVPLAMSVSPTSRSAAAQVGTTAPNDSASVTLSGDNSGSTAWTATKRKSWTTLTTANGTGSGRVRWSRSTTGLAVGTYVDTITVAASGVSSRTVIDTLIVTAAPVPLAMSVSPTSRSAAAQIGTAAPNDSASVNLSGDNSGGTAWTATKRKSWTTLTAANGTGSGLVRWSRSTTGLAVGTYVDTITVAATGVSSRTVIDTLIITAAPIPLAMSVSPASRSATAQVGTAAPNDSASVTLSGDNSGGTAWTATKRQSWTTLTTANGTGSGRARWSRSTSGLAAGTYVDTITIVATGVSSRTVIDTLIVTAAPVPLAMSVSPTSRSVTTQAGAAAPSDSASVTLSGDNSGSTAWTATKRKSWTTLTTASGTGSGRVRWSRSTAGLTAGTYVDTITVAATGLASRTVVDTLVVTPAPEVTPPPPSAPLVVAVAPGSRKGTIAAGNGWLADSATVTLSGTGAESATWTASARAGWESIQTTTGTGSGMLRWRRRLNGLSAGTYVDTITVALASGSTARLVDTLVITSSGGASLAKGGGKTRTARLTGANAATGGASAIIPDTLQLVGTSEPAQAWRATTTAGWLSIVSAIGAETPRIAFTRQPGAMPVGLHVDSIVVELVSNPQVRAVYVDTLEVVEVAAPVPDAAVEDLFRSNRLSADQRQALDEIGNRNRRFDLGDFLAWVERARIRLSPATVARLSELRLEP